MLYLCSFKYYDDMKNRIIVLLMLLLNGLVWLIMFVVSLPVALFFLIKRIFVKSK